MIKLSVLSFFLKIKIIINVLKIKIIINVFYLMLHMLLQPSYWTAKKCSLNFYKLTFDNLLFNLFTF